MAGARAGGTSTPRSTLARTRKSATSSPPSLRVSSRSIAAPISARVVRQPGAQRIEHHAIENQVGAGRDQRCNQRKRSRRRIGGNHDRLRHKLGLADERDAAAKIAVRLDAHIRTEVSKHLFGMIARRLGFDDDRLSRRGESGEKNGGLQLGRRQPAARTRSGSARAHL